MAASRAAMTFLDGTGGFLSSHPRRDLPPEAAGDAGDGEDRRPQRDDLDRRVLEQHRGRDADRAAYPARDRAAQHAASEPRAVIHRVEIARRRRDHHRAEQQHVLAHPGREMAEQHHGHLQRRADEQSALQYPGIDHAASSCASLTPKDGRSKAGRQAAAAARPRISLPSTPPMAPVTAELAVPRPRITACVSPISTYSAMPISAQPPPAIAAPSAAAP